jgi:type VI secretion system secreted protein VgrG
MGARHRLGVYWTRQNLKEIALSNGTSMQVRSGADGKSELIERDAMHMAEISLMRGGEQ